jgi:hypothetical protein
MTTVKRPREVPEIRALIRERKRNITKLEAALRLSLPQQDKRHLQQRLHGERMNLRSWEDWLAKQITKSKRSAA